MYPNLVDAYLASCLPGGWRSRERECLSVGTDEFLPTGWWSFIWSILGLDRASDLITPSSIAFRGARLFVLSSLPCWHLGLPSVINSSSISESDSDSESVSLGRLHGSVNFGQIEYSI